MTDLKELKKRFKQYVPPMGVFRIKNLANGKIFVGSAANMPARLNSLKFQLKNGLYMNHELQGDFTRLGEAQFSFETVDLLPMKDEPGYDPANDLAALEEMWLDELQPFGERGYNRKKGAKIRKG